MGSLLLWDEPPADATWTHSEIYRADSEDGDYSLIKTLVIEDLTYYDPSGESTNYYKVRFVNTNTSLESDYSSPMTGSDAYLYSNPDDVFEAIGFDKSNLPKEMTANMVYNFIWDVSRQIDKFTKTVYGRTETITDQVYSSKYLNNGKLLDTKYRYISSLTSVELRQGESSWRTLNDYYDYEADLDAGKVIFHTILIPNQARSHNYNDLKLNFTYGQTTIPDEIKQLTKFLAGIRAIVYMTGGSFDDITAYSLGEFNASLGEPYTNLRETIKMLETEKKRLMEATGLGDTIQYDVRMS